jgi:internalin A
MIEGLVQIPPELAELKSLETLDLSQTDITDISVLAELTKLTRLEMRATAVQDLRPLAELIALRELLLAQTKVQDLRPVSQLHQLERLMLDQTPVADIAPLAQLLGLRILELSDTLVTDLKPLADLSHLRQVSLWNTPVEDIAPLSNLHDLQQLEIVGTHVSNLRPLMRLRDVQNETDWFDLKFQNTAATRADPDIDRISKIQDERRRWDTLCDHLDGPKITQSPAEINFQKASAHIDKKLKLMQRKTVTGLEIRGADLERLPPQINQLTTLKNLTVSSAPLFDLSPLIGLDNLEKLSCLGSGKNASCTSLQDITPLGQLPSLRNLDLMGRRAVTDLRPLSKLASLEWLILYHTGVVDLSPLNSLQTLQLLDVRDTQITDIGPVAHLTSLKIFRIGFYTEKSTFPRMSPTSNVSLFSDISPLAGLTMLNSIDLLGTSVTNLSPLLELGQSKKRGSYVDVAFRDIPATHTDPELKRISHIRDAKLRWSSLCAHLSS